MLTLLIATFAGAIALGSAVAAQPRVSNDLPNWIKQVGARRVPKTRRTFVVAATGDGITNSSKAIQKAIDDCAKSGGGVVTFRPGQYVTGALFLKSNVHLRIDRGVTLLGSQDDADYPSIWTRVAGIEMKWPAALINVNDQRNVKISGSGTIDGRGEKWWDKYWTLRREYEPRGLRWASDYDAERVRLMVVWKSSDVTVEKLNLKHSGFWTVQVVYSAHVTVDGLKITDNKGPSTDGVDIDSSSYVLVQNCDIDNNDDDICLKALGLRKDIQLRESMKIQLRVEFINAFNHPLFPGPTVNAGSSGFGAISTSNQLNYARRAQLAAKFIF